MALAHLSIKSHTRSKGHTVAAAAAYRTGLDLMCERTGTRHNYARRSRRDEIADHGLVAPRPTPLAHDIQTWTTAVESAENRKNSMVCRDVEVSLPHELPERNRNRLAREYARWISERYNTPCAFAVHKPSRRGDQRNHHVHILMPTRALTPDATAFGKKLRILDVKQTSALEILAMRAHWQELANAFLKAAGLKARVNMARRDEVETLTPLGPQPAPKKQEHPNHLHLGPRAAAIERKAANAPSGMPIAEVVQITNGVTERGQILAKAERAKREESLRLERIAKRQMAVAQTSHPPIAPANTPLPELGEGYFARLKSLHRYVVAAASRWIKRTPKPEPVTQLKNPLGITFEKTKMRKARPAPCEQTKPPIRRDPQSAARATKTPKRRSFTQRRP